MPRTCRFLRFFLLAPVLWIAVAGCGGSSDTGPTQVAPTEQAKQAEKNQEDFMKNQGKK